MGKDIKDITGRKSALREMQALLLRSPALAFSLTMDSRLGTRFDPHFRKTEAEESGNKWFTFSKDT